MKRMFILIFVVTLTFVIDSRFTSYALADDMPPSHVDIMDQAYLAEYQQRAVEAYATMLAVQARRKAEAASQMGEPDWFGEIFLAEYEQRTRENYALFLGMPEKK